MYLDSWYDTWIIIMQNDAKYPIAFWNDCLCIIEELFLVQDLDI